MITLGMTVLGSASHSWVKRAQSDRPQEAVDGAEIGLEQHGPEQAADRQRNDHRHEIERAEHRASADAGIEQAGDQQRQNGLQDHGADREIGGVPERPEERLVVQQVQVVAEARPRSAAPCRSSAAD